LAVRKEINTETAVAASKAIVSANITQTS